MVSVSLGNLNKSLSSFISNLSGVFHLLMAPLDVLPSFIDFDSHSLRTDDVLLLSCLLFCLVIDFGALITFSLFDANRNGVDVLDFVRIGNGGVDGTNDSFDSDAAPLLVKLMLSNETFWSMLWF